jgi:tetrathionate reductase subunit B
MDKSSEKKSDRRAFVKIGGAAALAIAAASGLPSKVLAQAKSKNLRWGFLIDLRKCIGCKACSVACKTEFDTRLGYFKSSVKELEKGEYPRATRGFVPWLCNHCENPVCLEDCPVDEVEATFAFPGGETVSYKKRATYKRPDGAVLVDQHRCVGCGACVRACPYDVRFLDESKQAGGDPNEHPADKCTLCVHRLDEGIVPSCVNTCQGRARMAGDLSDPGSEISKALNANKTAVLLPEENTDPRCFYIGLDPEVYKLGRDTKDEAEQA